MWERMNSCLMTGRNQIRWCIVTLQHKCKLRWSYSTVLWHATTFLVFWLQLCFCSWQCPCEVVHIVNTGVANWHFGTCFLYQAVFFSLLAFHSFSWRFNTFCQQNLFVSLKKTSCIGLKNTLTQCWACYNDGSRIKPSRLSSLRCTCLIYTEDLFCHYNILQVSLFTHCITICWFKIQPICACAIAAVVASCMVILTFTM